MSEVTAASIRDNEVTAASILGTKRETHANSAMRLLVLATKYMERRDAQTYRRGPKARKLERQWYANAMYTLAVAQVEATLAAAEA